MAIPAALTKGGWLRVVLAGLLLGCALTAKLSSLPLLVVLPVLVWVVTRTEAAPLRATVLRALGVVAVAFFFASVICGPTGVAALYKSFDWQRRHAEAGHPAYAFGLYKAGGWWWYFPAAWAVKTPLPLLAATLSGVGVIVATARRRLAPSFALLLPPVLLAGASVATPLNLGVRYWLPLTPFLAVCGGAALAAIWRRAWWGRVLAAAAVIWLALGTLLLHPDEMAYANELAGGSKNTWRLLTDSNVDWGQDLPALADVVGQQPVRRLYLAYFGTADPSGHGLRDYCWQPSYGLAPQQCRDGMARDGRELVAVSATQLIDIFTPKHDAYAWLRERPMAAFPGHSIAVYDITGDEEAHRRLGEKAFEFQFFVAAEPPLRRALEIAPNDVRARLYLAGALVGQQRWDDAVDECQRAEQLRPGSSNNPYCKTALDHRQPKP